MSLHQVTRINNHQSFSASQYSDDIAILKLDGSGIDFSASDGFSGSVCLPGANTDWRGLATVTGWGNTQEEGSPSVDLLAADVPFVTESYCRRRYGKYLKSTHLCAGAYEGRDACQGDSGGPLIQHDNSGRAVLAGIVSFGNGCGRSGWP